MSHEDQVCIRVVRHLDGGVLGQEFPQLIPLAITDDRNSDPLYESILDVIPDAMNVAGWLYLTSTRKMIERQHYEAALEKAFRAGMSHGS